MKILSLISGRLQEVLPIKQSTGTDDAEKTVQTGSDGKLDASLMPSDFGGPDVIARPATEAIAAGAAVNVYNNNGTSSIRNADASNPAKQCNGFVKAAVASGASGNLYDGGFITGLSGLSTGQRMYLSATTPGALTSTPVTTAGAIHQFIGSAVSADTVAFEPSDPITLAASA